MPELLDVVEAYFQVWNETNASARAEAIAAAWSEDGRYVDPLADAAGHGAIAANTEAVQAQFPGHTFRLTSGVDAHHDQVRFTWDLNGPDGGVVVSGIDVGALAPDGRLSQITGFFGPLPEPTMA